MRCYRRLLNISYKDHVTNEDVRNRIQNLLTMVKKGNSDGVATSQDPLARRRQFCRGQWKEQEGEEDRRRDDKIESRNGVWRFPVGSGRQGRVERHCCNVICGAPTTSEVKGLRLDACQFGFWKVRTKKMSI